MSTQSTGLSETLLAWLLEPDEENPGIRYFTLRDLLARPEEDPEVRAARADVMTKGPIPAILDAQHPDGYWAKSGGGHSPSYRVTVWQIIFLAELGADPGDGRVQRGCEYLRSHSIATNGALAMSQRPVPSSVVHCLNGDPLHALLRLGRADDPRVRSALDWQVQVIVGDEHVQYYKSGTAGPGFACAYNLGQPCAWGATKAMKAFGAIPQDRRTPAVQRAIEVGAEFLLSHDLAAADYPYTERVNASWFKFGFPLSFRSDILETVAVLAALGYGADSRLGSAIEYILEERDEQDRWAMEKSLNGKMWADIEQKGKPSKWVTLRALCALSGLGYWSIVG